MRRRNHIFSPAAALLHTVLHGSAVPSVIPVSSSPRDRIARWKLKAGWKESCSQSVQSTQRSGDCWLLNLILTTASGNNNQQFQLCIEHRRRGFFKGMVNLSFFDLRVWWSKDNSTVAAEIQTSSRFFLAVWGPHHNTSVWKRFCLVLRSLNDKQNSY